MTSWITPTNSRLFLGAIALMTSLVLAGLTTPTVALVTLSLVALSLMAGDLDAGTRTVASRTGDWWANSAPTTSSKPGSHRDDGAFLSRISDKLSHETYALHEECDQPHIQRDYRKGWNERARTLTEWLHAEP